MTIDMRRRNSSIVSMFSGLAMLMFAVIAVAEDAVEIKKPSVSSLEPMAMGNVAEVTLGLLAVLVAIFVIAWVAKRFGSFNSTASGNLRILGGLSVGQRERVMLIQVGDKQILIGVAPGRVEALHVLEEPIDVPEQQAGQDNFSQRLQAALNQRVKK